jgi:hypothetical protein
MPAPAVVTCVVLVTAPASETWTKSR